MRAVLCEFVRPARFDRPRSLRAAGTPARTLILDDGWQACGQGVNGGFHDKDGVPLMDPKKFPDVSGMTAKAHSLGLKVTAEGIEYDDQRSELLDLACDRGQGYLFSRPITAEAAITAMRKRRS